jgi:hypothetical protein
MSKKLRCNPSAGDCSSEEAFGTKIPFFWNLRGRDHPVATHEHRFKLLRDPLISR